MSVSGSVDLSAATGLSVSMNLTSGELDFSEGAGSAIPAARTVGGLAPVMRSAVDLDPDTVAYHLYRDVVRLGDERSLSETGIKYDLTVTLPQMLGSELPKTSGHYHPSPPGEPSFPEIYEVIHGRAAFVLQSANDPLAPDPAIEAVWVQVCAVGERIVIPGHCGHVTVNIGSSPLVVADLVSTRCGHLYGSFHARQGASYYVLGDPSAQNGFRLEANPAYQHLPDPVIAVGSRCFPWLDGGSPIYVRATNRADQFDFLDAPSLLAQEIDAIWNR